MFIFWSDRNAIAFKHNQQTAISWTPCVNQPCKRFPDYSCVLLRVQILMCAYVLLLDCNGGQSYAHFPSNFITRWVDFVCHPYISLAPPPWVFQKINFFAEPFEGPCTILPFYFLVVPMAPKQQIKLSLSKRPCRGTQWPTAFINYSKIPIAVKKTHSKLSLWGRRP